MHIEVRAEGKRKKYYYASSFRKGGKVRKLRFFLGYNLTKKEIEEKAKKARNTIEERMKLFEIIRDPLRTAISSEEIKEIELLEKSVDFKIFHLTEDDWKKFTKEFSYNTNAIEGSTVTEDEAGKIIEKKEKPPWRSSDEINETLGVAEAVKFTRKIREHISVSFIKKLHKIVFGKSKKFSGRLREKGKEVAVVDAFGNIIHRGAPSSEVEKLLRELVFWYNKNKKKYSPIVLAVVVHNQFETIHPFEDGNGRVGRLLLNNILLRHGLAPVNIELKNRREYYDALQEYQKRGNIRPMIELILKEYKSLKKIINR